MRTKRITEEDSLLAKLPEDIVFEAKSKFYGVPLKKIEEDFIIPPEILSQVPEEAARIYKFIAFGKTDDGVIEIGIVNPQDVRVLDALKFILTSKNLDAKIYLIMPRQFDALFQQYSSLHGEVKEALEHLEEDIADIDQMAGKEEYRPEELTADAPISEWWRLFSNMLLKAERPISILSRLIKTAESDSEWTAFCFPACFCRKAFTVPSCPESRFWQI